MNDVRNRSGNKEKEKPTLFHTFSFSHTGLLDYPSYYEVSKEYINKNKKRSQENQGGKVSKKRSFQSEPYTVKTTDSKKEHKIRAFAAKGASFPKAVESKTRDLSESNNFSLPEFEYPSHYKSTNESVGQRKSINDLDGLNSTKRSIPKVLHSSDNLGRTELNANDEILKYYTTQIQYPEREVAAFTVGQSDAISDDDKPLYQIKKDIHLESPKRNTALGKLAAVSSSSSAEKVRDAISYDEKQMYQTKRDVDLELPMLKKDRGNPGAASSSSKAERIGTLSAIRSIFSPLKMKSAVICSDIRMYTNLKENIQEK